MVKSVKLVYSLLICYAAAVIGSLATFPSISTWYSTIEKVSFNPPNWLFGPVWTILYTLMAISLYLIWVNKTKKTKKLAFAFFGSQLFLNVLWSLVFFGLHWLWISVVIIVALLGLILATIYSFWPLSRPAAYLLIPYAAWVSFATILNIGTAVIN